jgi:serine/threonine protein kinase
LSPPPYVAGLAVGTRFHERYEIVRLLGSGGMGTVYEARDTKLGRRVALKLPHVHLLGPSHRARFLREAQTAAQLWHPNICPIFDIAEVDATTYLTMAYLEGRPLGALVQDGPVETTLATRIVRTLATALQAAHDAKVLHLDLKPGNVMVGPHHNPIIMDFGLSRLISDIPDSATLDAGLLGTPAYMAPEQINGDAEAVSIATDVYALGVVLYELLTGRPPFQGSLLSVLDQARTETPISPRLLCSTVDERIATLCMTMLAKQPNERPASMTEVVEALEIIEGAERSAPVAVQRKTPADRERLSEVLSRRQAWEALYYAKRLLQVNQHDKEAYRALSQLSGDQRDLVCYDEARKQYVPNAFTRSMDVRTLVDFVRESGLIERDDGDIICRYNDPSDNMFLILRGEVGVFKPRIDPAENDTAAGPDFRLGAGHIVGELAFALKRSRTATMRALGRASLLAFSVARLKELADRRLMGHALSSAVDSYLKRRVLKYVFDSAKYLSPTTDNIVDKWELVSHHADVLTIDHQQHPTLDASACGSFTDHRGLVILAGGEVRCQHLDGKVLAERDLPILFAHFDNRLVYTYPHYEIERPVTLIHLHQAAFQELDQVSNGELQAVIQASRSACAAQCYFDVFLSYSNRDKDIAIRWKGSLEAAGLRVFMDIVRPPSRFVPPIKAAILDSLVFMPLLTESTSAKGKRDNWVHHEINFRSDVFGERACIVPVNLGGGRVAQIAPGHSPIEATGRETEAIEQIVSVVRRVRSGESPAPFSLKTVIPDL